MSNHLSEKLSSTLQGKLNLSEKSTVEIDKYLVKIRIQRGVIYPQRFSSRFGLDPRRVLSLLSEYCLSIFSDLQMCSVPVYINEDEPTEAMAIAGFWTLQDLKNDLSKRSQWRDVKDCLIGFKFVSRPSQI
jgi:hypothetical protein